MVSSNMLFLSVAVLLTLLGSAHAVSVYVMMPLTVVNNNRQLDNPTQLKAQLGQLRGAGVDGIVVDVWWGLVERDGPHSYYWQPYQDLLAITRATGLKAKTIMSFHQCGGNVGDVCDIPLPQWVTSVGPQAFYTDREGHVDYEYISLGADTATIFRGRSPVQMYSDFMANFSATVLSEYADIIVEVQVSLGPAGEMRYPSYPSGTYPGVGEFQCYDQYMLADLYNAAVQAGHPEWGHGGPSNAGTYSQEPQDTGFWSGGNDNFQSPYGMFFLNWYSSALLQHGDRILTQANKIFSNYSGLLVAAKVSGVHWQYKSYAHAAECTAGYYNTNNRDAYYDIASMFSRHNVVFDFTCLEMYDSDQCSSCGPEELVSQVRHATGVLGVPLTGENALSFYDSRHYGHIQYQSSQNPHLLSFAYLRLSNDLLNGNNFPAFQSFVSAMHGI